MNISGKASLALQIKNVMKKQYIMQLSKVMFSVIYLQVVLCETPAYVAHWYSMFISKATEEREQKQNRLPCSRLLLIHCPLPSRVPSSERPLSLSGSTQCSLGVDLELKDIFWFTSNLCNMTEQHATHILSYAILTISTAPAEVSSKCKTFKAHWHGFNSAWLSL